MQVGHAEPGPSGAVVALALKNKDLDNPGSLGLQLISTMMDQLDGEIELQKSLHPVSTISFPM